MPDRTPTGDLARCDGCTCPNPGACPERPGGESEPTGDLRERLAEALYQWTVKAAGAHPLIPTGEAALRENSLARADAVLPVVRAALDRAERQVREQVAADLQRAAAGRRDYASRAPDHMAAVLEAEARVFDTASRVATQPGEVMWGLLPAAMWTDADRRGAAQ